MSHGLSGTRKEGARCEGDGPVSSPMPEGDMKKPCVFFCFSVMMITACAYLVSQEQPEIVIQSGHTAFVNSMAISADGKYIVSGSDDRTVRLWDRETGKELRRFTGHTEGVNFVDLSSDGKYIVSGSRDNTVRLWERDSGKELRRFEGHTDDVNSVTISADGKYIVSGSRDHTVRLWDSAKGKELRRYTGHTDDVNSITISTDGQYIISGSWDNTVRLWDRATGKELRRFEGHTDWVRSVAISADGQYIVSGSWDQTVRLWERDSGKEMRRFEGHNGSVESVSLSSDGKTIISGSRDHTVRLWDTATGKELVRFTGHTDYVTSVAISADGKTIVSGSWDNTVRLWDRASGKELRRFEGHTSFVLFVAISADGQCIVSGSMDHTVRLWDRATGKELSRFEGHTGWVRSADISADCKYIVSGSDDKTVRLWDTASDKKLRLFEGHTDRINSVAINADGQYIVSGSNDKTVRLWDTATGKELRHFTGHTGFVNSVAISADGKYIVSGSDDQTVRLWERDSGKELSRFEGHTSLVRSVSISADGQYIVSGSWDKTVRLWDRATGKELRCFEGHILGILSVDISAEGKYIVSGSFDDTVRLWDKDTGKELQLFKGHTFDVTSVALSADGKYFVLGSREGKVKIWHAGKGELLASLVGFTDGEWLAYTPGNHYVCSSNGEKYVTFRLGHEIFDAAKYPLYRSEEAVARALRPGSAVMIAKQPEQQVKTETRKPQVEKETGKTTKIDTGKIKILPPEIIFNFFQCGDKKLAPGDQIVASPKIDIKAVIVDPYYGIKRVIIQVNGAAVINKILAGQKRFDIAESITLKEKENLLKIIAYNSEDAKGESREIKLTYQKELLKGMSLTELIMYIVGKSRSWAVLIAINNYSKATNGFDFLPYAKNDAEAIRQFLMEELGFKKERIKTLYNEEATKKGIETWLGEILPNKVGDNDRVLVYFSGYGGQEKGAKKKQFGYLIPIDGKKNKLFSTCVSMNQLQFFSDKLPARQALFILDSCFSGIAGTIYKKEGSEIPKETRKQVEAFVKSEGRQIMTAGGADETTSMSSKWNNHSVYTFYLINGLKGAADYNKDSVISVRELQVYLDSNVPKEAKQTPQLFNLSNSEGQFVFYREGDY